jgi:signal transduction histidine kinase
MPIKYYVLPEEREQMQKEAVKRATFSIKGPVSFYENWPGEGPRLTITEETLQAKRPFCKLIWEDQARKKKCREDHEERSASCMEAQVAVCWCGVHNAVCPVREEDEGHAVTLTGGEFRVRERQAEAREQLERFLGNVPPEQRETFREAWLQMPEVSESEVFDRKMHELEVAGRDYLYALKQRNDFRYLADLITHDVVIDLQALIADIEVLKIELKESFNIGKKWEDRFEILIKTCEAHTTDLESRIGLDKPQYNYYSINKLIHECVEAYVSKAKARIIEFQLNLEREVDEEGKYKVLGIRMDRPNLKQALTNVIDNAVKYSFSGAADYPRHVDITGRLQKAKDMPGYIIEISNLGIGIEEEELDLVFESGYQGRRRLDEARTGYGIGLTFVKECVKKHGGTISLRSKPQQRTGWLTTVRIWLPLHGPTEQNTQEV